jgi:hypothetical protein
VPFASFDLLAGIEPARTTSLGRFNRLAVDHSCGGNLRDDTRGDRGPSQGRQASALSPPMLLMHWLNLQLRKSARNAARTTLAFC